MLEVISFDMDGTLVSSRYVEKVWLEGMPLLYAKRHRLQIEEAKKRVYDEYMSVGTGDLRWYSLPHWLGHFDLDEKPGEILERYRDQVEVYPETEEVLSALSERFDLVVTSNGAREFVDIELGGLRPYFREMLSTTSDFRLVKSPEAYAKICSHLGVKPDRMLHVGDHRTYDYEMPLQAGLRALYLDRDKMDRGDHVVGSLREAAARILNC